jgi:hypothetical protein
MCCECAWKYVEFLASGGVNLNYGNWIAKFVFERLKLKLVINF